MIDDASDTDEILLRTLSERCPENISKPWYGESINIVETDEEIYVDLIWKEKEIMLFLSENVEDYKKALKTDFHCYCLAENFDIDEFILQIEV